MTTQRSFQSFDTCWLRSSAGSRTRGCFRRAPILTFSEGQHRALGMKSSGIPLRCAPQSKWKLI